MLDQLSWIHKHESLHTKAPLKYFSKEDHTDEKQISYINIIIYI